MKMDTNEVSISAASDAETSVLFTGEEITLAETADMLKSARKILIIAHARPDGDTIGSCMALRELLNMLGKETLIVCDDDLGARLRRVFSTENFPVEAAGEFESDLIVACDVAQLELAGEYGKKLEGIVDLKIDHHPDGARYAKKNYIDSTAPAVGEIMFRLAKELGVLNMAAAEYMYAAIASDTGGFKYSNVTPFTFRTAAELLEYGVDCAAINHELFECITRKEIVATTAAYNALHYYLDGRIACICFTNRMKEENELTDEDIGNLASLPRRIMGVELAVVIKQKSDEQGQFKISMRSGPTVKANELCAIFGGGGHARAAGAMTDASDGVEAEKKIIETVINAMESGIGIEER